VNQTTELKIRSTVVWGTFTGTFCYTCGFYDYFDDLRYVLKEFNLSTEILEVKEVDGGAIVKFKLIKEN